MTSKERKKRFNALSQYGCCICRQPAEIHHLIGSGYRGMSQKADDKYTIPLCPNHHRGQEGIHQIGMETWEKAYGSQKWHLEYVNKFVKKA